jgi:hypothetical protein
MEYVKIDDDFEINEISFWLLHEHWAIPILFRSSKFPRYFYDVHLSLNHLPALYTYFIVLSSFPLVEAGQYTSSLPCESQMAMKM